MADDIDFKKAMRGVRLLRKDSSVQSMAPRKPDRALRVQIQDRARQSAQFAEEINTAPNTTPKDGLSNRSDDETLFYLSHGVQKKVLRELKKGSRYSADHILDLHGLSQPQAQIEIDYILKNLESAQLACLLIIHGKGLHSPNGATLKEFTAAYLKSLVPVKAYCSAQQRDGGTGALYVLVKG